MTSNVKRTDKIKELNAACNRQKINLSFKVRRLKKDPLQMGRADIANGAVYFEYIEDAKFPNGAFIVLTLGGLYDTPNAELKELEQTFINIGFHKTVDQLVTALHETLRIINGLSSITLQ